MASQLFALIAATGLVAFGTPALATAPIAKSAKVTNVALIKPAAKPAVGVCLVPVAKGKVAQLADLRKARAAGKCSNDLMQGGAAVSTGLTTTTSTAASTLTSTLVTVGVSTGISVGINQAINNSNTDI